MSDEVDRQRPAHGSVVELFPASRADALVSWSEGPQDDDLIVSAPLDRSQRPVSLAVGEHLEIVWRDADELRALPVVLASIEVGERPRWLLRAAGVIRRGQRRDAVRAPLTIPVQIGPEPATVTGTTVDVSEGGLRCVLDTGGPPTGDAHDRDPSADPSSPRAGDVVKVAALFPDFTITCPAEVTRVFEREDPRLELSLRFIGLTENQQDLIRRRVFARLRELRHRGLL
jgi:PilZ domain